MIKGDKLGVDPWGYPIFDYSCSCGYRTSLSESQYSRYSHKCVKKLPKKTSKKVSKKLPKKTSKKVSKKLPKKTSRSIIGRTYGNLEVIEKGYIARCLLCGNVRKISYGGLKGNIHNLHCGCLGSKKLVYPPIPRDIPGIVLERFKQYCYLLREFDVESDVLLRACWISHCRDIKGDSPKNLKNYLLSHLRYECYNSHITINRFSDMTTSSNLSAYDATGDDLSGVQDPRRVKKIKFQRR